MSTDLLEMSYAVGPKAPVAHLKTVVMTLWNVWSNQGRYETIKAVGTIAFIAGGIFIPIHFAHRYSMTGTFFSEKNEKEEDLLSKNWVIPSSLLAAGLTNVFAYYVYHRLPSFPSMQCAGLLLQHQSSYFLSLPIKSAHQKMREYFQIQDDNQADNVALITNIAAICLSAPVGWSMNRSGFDPILTSGISLVAFTTVSFIAFPIFAAISKTFG